MQTFHTKVEEASHVDGEMVLPYHLREKSRFRAQLRSGEEVAVLTARGTVLRHGDLIRSSDGRVVRIHAAPEATYRVECQTPQSLVRCAFHLGNRHTQAQVSTSQDGAGSPYLRIRKDAVLKEMLEGLGAEVIEEHAPFEPESGAYGGGHHHDQHQHQLLAPIPLRQKIHRPSDR